MRTFFENLFLTVIITIFISIVYLLLQRFVVYEGATTLTDVPSTETVTLVQDKNNKSAGFNIQARSTDINMANIYIPEIDDLIEKMNSVLTLARPENYGIKIGSITMDNKCSDTNVCPLPIITITGDPGNQVMNFVIPQGPDGPMGLPGKQGFPGPKGLDGDIGDPGLSCNQRPNILAN